MILFLRLFFVAVLGSMLWVTTWASLQCPLFAIPREVYSHPWFIATLFDAYWGFLTFYCWIAYKQVTWTARIAWLVAVLLFGNIAMAAYCLDELFRVPRGGRMAEVLTARRPGVGGLGLALAAIGILVTLLGASQ